MNELGRLGSPPRTSPDLPRRRISKRYDNNPSPFVLSHLSVSQSGPTERRCESLGAANPQRGGGEQVQRRRLLLLGSVHAVSGHRQR